MVILIVPSTLTVGRRVEFEMVQDENSIMLSNDDNKARRGR